MADGAERTWIGPMAEIYDRYLVPTVFDPFARDLAARISALRPRSVLELAAGTGALTRHLVAGVPDAEVTATDLNQAMVEWGRRQVPAATWRPADATALPHDDHEVDVVACQFGVMFFPDKVRAFAEVRRVLRPDGRLVFNVWGPLGTHAFADALVAGLEQVFPDDPPRFVAAVPHGYADEGQVREDLGAGGLRCLSAEPLDLDGRAESVADLARGFCTGTPLRAAISERGDVAEATAAVARAMEDRLGPGPVTGGMRALVVVAAPDRPLDDEAGR